MKKKLLFKNSTQYSKKAYNKFNQFHNNNNVLKYELFTVLIIILLIYCIVTTIKGKVIPLAVLFLLALIFFVIHRFFGPIRIYKKEVTKKAITKTQTFNFYFYDKFFKVRDNLDFHKQFYFKLHKVYETDEFFYLYIDKQYSFIVDKSGFTKGTSEEFSNFIRKKILFKYKNSAE